MRHFTFRGESASLRRHAIERIRAQSEVKKPKEILFHVFSGIPDRDIMKAVADDLIRAFPESHIAGVVSNGEIREGHLQEPCVLISAFFFDIANIKILINERVSEDPSGAGIKILETVRDTPDVRALEFLYVGGGYDPRLIFSEVERCRRSIVIFGGIAAGHNLPEDPVFVMDRTGVYTDALLTVVYSGKGLWIDADRTAGWNRLGQAFSITGSDGKRLIEVNGRPAVDIYDHYLQIPQKENFVTEAAEFPLMVLQDGEQMLRHPVSLADEGTLLLAGDVQTGSRLYITYGNPSIIIDEVNIRCENVRQFEPEAILLFSCAVRKVFWEDFVDNEVEPFQRIAPSAGFFTGGEILRNMRTGKIFVHNITLLSIAMREGTKTGRKVARVHVDDTMLKGQASLVRRLAKLVQSTMDEVLALNDQLTRMATMDELTNLYNRREIERRILEALAAFRESGEPVSLIMLDIDHFKNVNDTCGHDVGDQVLKNISAILRNAVKHNRSLAAGRWGGEEFFIMLPGMDIEEACDFAEDVRSTVERFDFKGLRRLTASFGVICPTKEMEDNAIFKAVDDALYYAKEHGRNQVVRASLPGDAGQAG